MRHFNILFAFAFVLLTSCFTDDVDYVGYQPSSKGGIHIIGAVEEYDIKSVGTRADDDGIADSYISEMTMFIFDKNNNLIQGYTDVDFGNECTSAINIQRGNPTFLIDTEEGILADLSGGSDADIVYYKNDVGDILNGCNIYIVANAWHQLSAPIEEGSTTRFVDNIKKLTDLEAFVYQADNTLAMPTVEKDGATQLCGFPMIGKQQGASFDLRKEGNNDNNAVATIPLKKLYSKVRFTMQINADQVVAGQTPKFTISKVEVFNVPNKARLGRKVEDGELVYNDYLTEMNVTGSYTVSDYYHYAAANNEPFVINKFNKKTISHSTSLTTDDVIEFGFYMPEHKVTPNRIQLPNTMTDEEKEKYAQYYKPTGVGAVPNGDGTISPAKIATFVRIHGSYTDHNSQILDVKYDIYLGQNNFDDFTIKRNQLLNNKLIITGLTNHKNAYGDVEGNISIDHRVEVADRGFNLSMERTAILDAHFEVRPLDIELQPGANMTITIPEAHRSWVAMEDDYEARRTKANTLYVNTENARKGVRKYFTTNLVTDLWTANKGRIELKHSGKDNTKTEIFRIWFYIDENPNVYDKTGATSPNGGTGGYTVSKEQYRVCPVLFSYKGTKVVKDEDTDEDVTVNVTKEETINFQQWNLWRVWSADGLRYYDIEHEEEYLNNYASDLQYGNTQDGMPWGLNGVQLSDEIFASWKQKTSTGWFASIIDAIFNTSGTTSNVFVNSGKEPYYDFYLSRDKFPVDKLDNVADSINYKRDYKGIEFNKEIAATLKTNYAAQQVAHTEHQGNLAQIEKLNLTQSPSSAFAYCYHKNKRNDKGEVVEQKWFLPAIDEIEDIALGAYDEFDRVFQNEEYWSCLPAYERYTMKLTGNNYLNLGLWKGYVPLDGLGGVLEGEFYIDNTNRARSTSVYTTDGTNYTNIESGTPSTEYGGNLDVQAYKDGPKDNTAETTYSSNTVNYNATIYTTGEYRGNSSRTESCRIRAVYRSGTKQ